MNKEVRDLYEAAKDSLKSGSHIGPCTNESYQDEACELHCATADLRRDILTAAIARFEDSDYWLDGADEEA